MVPPDPDELIASVMRTLADAEAAMARAPRAAQAADFMIRELLERERWRDRGAGGATSTGRCPSQP
jgi:hypothetical protein